MNRSAANEETPPSQGNRPRSINPTTSSLQSGNAAQPWLGQVPNLTGPSIAAQPGNTSFYGNGRKLATSRVVSDPDKMLIFMMIDFLKRKGLLATANQLILESRMDGLSSDTAEAVQFIDYISHLHGRNPQPGMADAGFLRDWWGSFWQLFQAKVIPPGGSLSPTMSTPVPAPTRPPAGDGYFRRMMLMNAMQMVGLAGKDPMKLTVEEQRLVNLAIQQLGMRQQPQNQQAHASIQSSSPLLSPAGETTSKKKKIEPSSLPIMAGPFASSGATVTSNSSHQQYLMHLRTLQLQQLQQQQHQQQMQHKPIGSNPSENNSTNPRVSISPNPNVQKNKKEEIDHSNNQLDESALLTFFGSPEDWFSKEQIRNEGLSHFEIDGGKGVDFVDQLLFESGIENGIGLNLHTPSIPEKISKASNPVDSLFVAEPIEPNPQINNLRTNFELVKNCDLGSHTSATKAMSAAFSQDGLLMASAGHDKRILIFCTKTKSLLFALEGYHTQQINQVRFSPIGNRRLLSSASFDKSVNIWDFGEVNSSLDVGSLSKDPVMTLRDVHEEPVWSVDFIYSSSKGLRLSSIDASGKLAIWNLETGQPIFTTIVRSLEDPSLTIRQIKTRPTKENEPPILAITNGTNIEFLDCDETTFKGTLLATTKGKTVVALNWGHYENPNLLITATSDSFSAWDLSPLLLQGSPPLFLTTLPLPADKITCCSFIQQIGNKVLVAVGGYQAIYLWEFDVTYNPQNSPSEERKPCRPTKIQAHEGLVVSLPVTRSKDLYIGSVSHDSTVKLWQLMDLQTGLLVIQK